MSSLIKLRTLHHSYQAHLFRGHASATLSSFLHRLARGSLSRRLSSNQSRPVESSDQIKYKEPARTSILMELTDRVGVLHDVLRYFWKYDINITRIESRPATLGAFDFFVDFEGRVGVGNVDTLLDDLNRFQDVDKLLLLDMKEGKFWCPIALCTNLSFKLTQNPCSTSL